MSRLLLVITEDWYFVSHRLEYAIELKKRGHQVAVACRFSTHREAIVAAGIEVYSVDVGRNVLSLQSGWRYIQACRRAIAEFRPDVVQFVALKPIVMGGIASFGKRYLIVNTFTGLGWSFTDDGFSIKRGLVRSALVFVLRFLAKKPNCRNVFQNEDDARLFQERRIVRAPIIIRGAGIRVADSVPQSLGRRAGAPVIMFAGRLIRAKGVEILLQASVRLMQEGVKHRLWIAGEVDVDNPASLSLRDQARWRENTHIEFLGRIRDVEARMAQADIVALPTFYREGVPKVILEAGAQARAVVATDVAGCREIVRNGETGLLVAPQDETALRGALATLVADGALRETLGRDLFRLVRDSYSLDYVVNEFDRLFSGRSPL